MGEVTSQNPISLTELTDTTLATLAVVESLKTAAPIRLAELYRTTVCTCIGEYARPQRFCCRENISHGSESVVIVAARN